MAFIVENLAPIMFAALIVILLPGYPAAFVGFIGIEMGPLPQPFWTFSTASSLPATTATAAQPNDSSAPIFAASCSTPGGKATPATNSATMRNGGNDRQKAERRMNARLLETVPARRCRDQIGPERQTAQNGGGDRLQRVLPRRGSV